jgi:hypothetical protein
MRRIDIIWIGLAIFLGGGMVYILLQLFGLDTLSAGIWTQAGLIVGLVGWVASYAYRAVTQTMTYNQQRQEYEDAVLQKRLESLSPEELAQLQAELDPDLPDPGTDNR